MWRVVLEFLFPWAKWLDISRPFHKFYIRKFVDFVQIMGRCRKIPWTSNFIWKKNWVEILKFQHTLAKGRRKSDMLGSLLGWYYLKLWEYFFQLTLVWKDKTKPDSYTEIRHNYMYSIIKMFWGNPNVWQYIFLFGGGGGVNRCTFILDRNY